MARPPGSPWFVVKPVIAPSDTPWVAPDPPNPTAHYGSFQAASDQLRAIVRHTLGAYSDSAKWHRAREPFWYNDAVHLVRVPQGTYYWDAVGPRDSAVTVPCLHMRYGTHTAGAPGNDAIREALMAAGWDMDNRYSADGPDGTYFAMACGEALVEIRGSWEGGDDSDTTYVPAPGEAVELRCVPRPPEPRPRGRRAH